MLRPVKRVVINADNMEYRLTPVHASKDKEKAAPAI
jgi:hypothetical protein